MNRLNLAQRVALLVAVLVLLFAATRALTPFTGTEGSGPNACGIAAFEAIHSPVAQGPRIVLTQLGEAQRARAVAMAQGIAAQHGIAPDAYWATPDAAMPPGAALPDDSHFDHVTVTDYILTGCTKAARRRLIGVAVLAGAAVIGGLLGAVLLASRHAPTTGDKA